MRLSEFAPDDNNGGKEDFLHKYAKMWWNGDNATQQKVEQILDRMGWEIGEDEGGYDNGGVFVVRAGDENGKSYISWSAEDLTEAKKKKKKKSSQSLRGYFFPGYAYYGGGNPGEDAGDGGGESKNRGVAEANDPKFVGFMNKAMADKVDAPKADPLAKAPDWYKNAPAMNFDSMPGHKKALQFGLRVLSKLDPETKKQLAAGGEWAICEYIQDVAERTGNLHGDNFVEEDIWECQDYLSDAFHDPNITSWVDVLKTNIKEAKQKAVPSSQRDPGALATRQHIAGQEHKHKDWAQKQKELEAEFYANHPELDDRKGVAQGSLEEKSTSQAQFRTMAAAAHNPKFARKVGIKPSVAKEFHKADRGQSYKSLPKKA